jgi:hypothetical protein
MSAILPLFVAHAKRATKLESLIVLMLAVQCGGLAPTTILGAEPTDPAARTDGATDDKTKAAQLLQDYRNDLVLIEGKTGRASGFIADVKGRKYLVSNAHVLANIKTPRYRLLDNSPLKLGAAMVAIGHDIIMVSVLEGGKGIPTVPFGEAEARFGDAVVVPGNAGGESVVNPLPGEVVGIGADRIEISARIEPGSSGSPIIHVRSGKAVGVATYLKIKPSLSSSGTNVSSENEVRRFGYRLDTVQRWQVVDWTRFYAEADEVRNIENTSDELETAFWDIGSASSSEQARHLYDSPAIRNAIDQYYLTIKQRPGQANGAARNLVASLRAVTQSDVAARRSFTYDFFRRRFEQEQAKRKEIITALDKLLENLR